MMTRIVFVVWIGLDGDFVFVSGQQETTTAESET
jgi:hypothetical protein